MSNKEIAKSLENDLTIQALLAILSRRRTFIVRTMAICFTLAALYCVVTSRRYSATAEIQVQKSSADGLGLESMMSSAGGDASDALDANITLQTQANILQSDTLALKVIKDLDLEHTRDFTPRFNPIGWVLGLISPAGPKDPASVPLEQAPLRRTHMLKAFAKNLTVKPVAGTRLIDVTYLSTDPKLSAAVVNHLTQGLVDYTFQTRYDATNEAAGWLSSQLDDLKKQAETLQARVVTLQKDSGVYSLGSDATGKELAYSATLDRLQQATASLTAATSNRILKGGLYEITRKGDPELISGLAGSSMAGNSPAINNSLSLIQSLRQQEATLEAQLATDTSRLGSANPKLGDERASLVAIDAQIKAEVSRIGQRAENDYRSAQSVEASLQHVYDQQREAANKLNDKAIEFMIAKQEAESSRTLYENLNTHLKEAGVLEGLHSSNITVVDPGRVPAKPVKPNVPLYLSLSLLGGAFLGSIGALFREATDDRIQSMEMVETALATPILAVLPLVNGGAARNVASYLPYRPGPKQLPASADEIEAARRLPVIDGPHTAFVESLRSLRTSILLSRSGAPPKVILVTSAAEDEGKSTVSVNLAGVFAQSNSSVLLIEADMRHPGLTRRFGYERTGGLSSMLSGVEYQNIPTIEAFSELPRLRVLPAGPVPPYPAELLGSDRMHELVESWRGMYDFVIIDSPPLLAVTDAQILARESDMTVLVARHGVSTRKSLERAYRKLVNDKDKVSVVLNGISRDSMSYGEYYGYRGGSKYYSED